MIEDKNTMVEFTWNLINKIEKLYKEAVADGEKIHQLENAISVLEGMRQFHIMKLQIEGEKK